MAAEITVARENSVSPLNAVSSGQGRERGVTRADLTPEAQREYDSMLNRYRDDVWREYNLANSDYGDAFDDSWYNKLSSEQQQRVEDDIDAEVENYMRSQVLPMFRRRGNQSRQTRGPYPL